MKYLYRLYAWVAGYFALPCHLCGREMYGFQHARCGSAMDSSGRCMMICPTCTKEGKGIDHNAEALKWVHSVIGQASGPPPDQSQLRGMTQEEQWNQLYGIRGLQQRGAQQPPVSSGSES